jgi:competence ComEA-like helix-hairpin-helix protein
MGVIKKTALKLGFTETELKVLLFITVVFLFGLGAYYFKYESEKPENTVYDYSYQDSLFFFQEENADSASKLLEKKVDSKQELLDFSVDKLYTESAEKPALTEKSIELNSADMKELTKLPGIGSVTAEKIIELRNSLGSFTSLNQLKQVKGIGEVKFNRIAKFLYIEKKNTLNPLEEQ